MINPVILFDGDCNFCHKGVQFIIKRDRKRFFYFASLQSEYGLSLLKKYQMDRDLDSMVLVMDGKVYTHSTAVIMICKSLSGLWKLLYASMIIPKPLRDIVYNLIAKRRYKWFGRQDYSCQLPPFEVRKRFLS